jgi:hypothetical protein
MKKRRYISRRHNKEVKSYNIIRYSEQREREKEEKRSVSRVARNSYQHDSSWITRPLNEDESVQSVLCGHSE